jgi:hypothetical protein
VPLGFGVQLEQMTVTTVHTIWCSVNMAIVFSLEELPKYVQSRYRTIETIVQLKLPAAATIYFRKVVPLQENYN